MLYHGAQQERRKLVRKIHGRQGSLKIHPVVITSFEIAMRDRNALQSCFWKYLIVDEGHRIKNMNCRLIRELKRFNADNKLLLTGTPLQNNLAELWSLLNFLLPDVVVYRLVTANTIDQKIVERAAAKRKLEKLIIHKNQFKGGKSGLAQSKSCLDPQELIELLKSRDYEREVKGSKEKVISDKDLELLLDRSDLIGKSEFSSIFYVRQ